MDREMGNLCIVTTLVVAGLAGVCAMVGCNSGPKYANVKPRVQNALAMDNLNGISISQDRNKGVITLTGTLSSEQRKLQAEDIAKGAAPKYTVADETTVVPPPSAVVTPSPTDIAIQTQFNKVVKSHSFLDRPGDDIKATATKGDVVLTGKVKTDYDKRAAEKLAKEIPNVHQVKNDLTVG